MNILITGAAGFIGASLSDLLLTRGDSVVGVDNLNDYYDVNLKKARLNLLRQHSKFTFYRVDISRRPEFSNLFRNYSFDTVVHLAAQAGVRYSMDNPHAYIDANLVGFANVLEECRHHGIAHLVYASSSSVYGENARLPSSETDNTDKPMSLYAATKKANEMMAHSYAHLYHLRTTGLRFFTAYGPWGRPDMALFKFTRNILAGRPIQVYNHGEMIRDFTYIDDIIAGVALVVDLLVAQDNELGASAKDCSQITPWKIYNIGNSRRVQLMDYIRTLEKELGRRASVEFLPMQDGDVPATEADISSIVDDLGYQPKIEITEGVARFVSWYQDYYRVSL